MTRPEILGTRSLVFSQWLKDHLPSSGTGLCIYNQDWVLWNYKTRRLLLCEEKCKHGELAEAFENLILKVLEPALKEFCAKNNIDFKGYYLVQFERLGPDDGKVFLNGTKVTPEELIKILSME